MLPVAGQDTLLIKTFGEVSAKLQRFDIVQVVVQTIDDMEVYVSAYVVPTICAPISNQMIQFTQETYPHLHGLELADNSHGSKELSVDLLIGADFYRHYVTGETVRDVNPGPVAILTKLGYVLSGPVNVSIHEQHESTINLINNQKLSNSGTSLGIRPNQETVVEQFSRDVHFNGERYEVSLPLKGNHELLPDNFQVSKSRLNSLLHPVKARDVRALQ